jgi:hypothetical protein
MNKMLKVNEIRRLAPQQEVHFGMTRLDYVNINTKAVVSIVLEANDDPHLAFFRLIRHIANRHEELKYIMKVTLILGSDDVWMILLRLAIKPTETHFKMLSYLNNFLLWFF